MSKSKGEFLTVDTLIDKGYDPLAFRLLVLGSHYRSALTFSWDALDAASTALRKARLRIAQIQGDNVQPQASFSPEYVAAKTRFFGALDKDLHTPGAVAELWWVLKADVLDDAERLDLLRSFDGILSVGLFDEVQVELTQEQASLIEARRVARLMKNWSESDRIRDLLLAQGIGVSDLKA